MMAPHEACAAPVKCAAIFWALSPLSSTMRLVAPEPSASAVQLPPGETAVTASGLEVSSKLEMRALATAMVGRPHDVPLGGLPPAPPPSAGLPPAPPPVPVPL